MKNRNQDLPYYRRVHYKNNANKQKFGKSGSRIFLISFSLILLLSHLSNSIKRLKDNKNYASFTRSNYTLKKLKGNLPKMATQKKFNVKKYTFPTEPIPRLSYSDPEALKRISNNVSRHNKQQQLVVTLSSYVIFFLVLLSVCMKVSLSDYEHQKHFFGVVVSLLFVLLNHTCSILKYTMFI